MNEAEVFAREDGLIEDLCLVLNNRGTALVRNNKDIIIAIDNYKESLGLQKQINAENHFILGGSYVGMSEAYLMSRDYHLALLYNDSAIREYESIDYRIGLRDSYEVRKSIFKQSGDYKSAYESYEVLRFFLDSLYDDDRSKMLNRMKTEYETEQKEAEIVSLSQQASIQTLEIKQKNQALIIGLIGFLFLLAVIYFIYKQQESKKQQSQTELEQRFLRSQLNPHFISNALVSVQHFLMKNDSTSAALYLTKFAKLMREILENSRKEFIPVEEEINMLRNFLDIHQLRLGTFEYTIELDENIDIEMDTIPPMFVQPFVENAIEHGIANLKKGEIKLRFHKEGDYISIEVNDNGVGLIQNKKAEHTSLSTTIIQERMALFNRSLKRKIRLVVDNLLKENGEIVGTKVELKVPFN